MLTNAQVKAARPRGRAYKIGDAGGLYLHVLPSSSRVFRVKFYLAGRECVLTIGAWPEVSLIEARAKRDAARELIDRGEDPRAAAAGAVQIRTFEIAARAWHVHCRQGWTPVHADQVMTSLERDVFPAIGAMPLPAITLPVVLAALRAIEARGSIETARRIRQRVGMIFDFAEAEGWCQAFPAAKILRALVPPPAAERQPAIVDAAELRQLLDAAELAAGAPVVKLAGRFLALTAVRLAALRGARWCEIEGLGTAAPIWRVPAVRMKLAAAKKNDSAHDHLVPLSAAAVAVLDRARAIAGDAPAGLIFPGVARGDAPIGESAIGRLYHRTPFGDRHVPHGWRASFSTIVNLRLFDSERRSDPGFIPTFGIRFVDAGVEARGGRRGPGDFLRFLRRLMDTAVSGASQLESRAIDDYYPVDIAVDVPTLSFSGLRSRAPAMIERGRLDVLRFFETTVGPQDPERMGRVLRVVAIVIRRRLGIEGPVRAYVLMRVPAGARARVFYSAGMEQDADDRMELDLGDAGPASPLLRREPVLVRYRALAAAPGGPHAKYERAMRPGSVVSAYSIPVFDDSGQWLVADPAGREEPYATLVLDAEEDMRAAVLDQEVEDLLAGVAQLVGEYVRGRRGPRPAPANMAAEDPSSGWSEVSAGGGCLVSVRKLRDPSDQPGTIDLVTAIEGALAGSRGSGAEAPPRVSPLAVS